MMPSAKTLSWSRAPPEKMSMRLSSPGPFCSLLQPMHCWTLARSTPGVGMTDPRRNRAMMPRVKRSFALRSGVLNAA